MVEHRDAAGSCHRVHIHAAMVFRGSCMGDIAVRVGGVVVCGGGWCS